MNCCDTHSDAPAVDHHHQGFSLQEPVDGGALLVTFSAAENPFVLHKMVCSNPDCELFHLSLLEVDDSDPEGEDDPLAFGFTVNIHQLGDSEARENMKAAAIRDGAPPALVTEFLDNFPSEVADQWVEDFTFNKAGVKQLQTYLIDKETLRDGVLVSFMDIYSNHDSIFRGGGCASFHFIYKNAEFFVDDMYCANPDCDCQEAVLHVAELIRGEDGRRDRLKRRFTARLSLHGKCRKMEWVDFAYNEARECLSHFQSLRPDLPDQLKNHYDSIKEVGERSYEAAGGVEEVMSKGLPVRTTKVGRNEPCTCGSGKKYKKCCGA